MKILVLTSAYPEPDDGTEVVTPTVKYFCDKWVEQGHEVLVIHNNSCFPLPFYWIPAFIRKKMESRMGHNFPVKSSRKPLSNEVAGVKVFRLPLKKIIPHGKFSKSKIDNQIKRIEDILDREQFVPGVIISHWVNPQMDLIVKLGKKYNAKTSLVFHGDCTEKNIEVFHLDEDVKELSAVGCRNEAYADYVKKRLNLQKKPFICYSGIPDYLAQKQKDKIDSLELENNLDFIYVGRLVKYKNVDVVIRALHEKYKNAATLHIVGEGAEEENLKQLSRQLNFEKNVVFHGQLSRNKVYEMMKKSYCFIMVSDNETFGMVYIEAMLAGCVTIASKAGGVDGVIVDGENGFLSKQGDVEELVKTLNRIERKSRQEITKIRKNAVLTAYGYRDSEIAKKYLDDVCNWKS